MEFAKLHGAGNDYLVMDGRAKTFDWPALAPKLCDYHFGVGSDGIAVIEDSDVAELRMRIFNPDGSEAEMSGNGIRCFTKYVLESGIMPGQPDSVNIETGGGIRIVEPTWENHLVTGARVSMGEPEFRWKSIPVNTYEASIRDDRELDSNIAKGLGLTPDQIFFKGRLLMTGEHKVDVTAVSMGNPNAVQFLKTPVAEFPLSEVGPLVEWNPAFPTRINYHIVNVISKGELTVRTWERGAQETLASGTGSCSTVVAARLHGLVDDEVIVNVPGGILKVTWKGIGPVYLEGPVARICTGNWEE